MKTPHETRTNKRTISLYRMGLANSRGSWVVGRMSWVVGKKSWVVGKKSWVVGKKSWVVGKKSWVPRKKSWVLRKKSWVLRKKSWVPRKSLGFEAKCFRIVTFFLLECVFFCEAFPNVRRALRI
jgi:hypothetical protein